MTELTTAIDEQGNLHIGPRIIPPPASISAQARKFLATPFPNAPQPPATDKAAWKRVIAAVDRMYQPLADQWLATAPVTVETIQLGGVTVHKATPHSIAHPERAHVRIHGGAWMFMGGKYAKGEAALTAAQFGCVTFGVDYRMPPDHPYPAAVDDGVAVWRAVIEQYDPRKVAMTGTSAGGNLTAAVTLKARDSGLPMPACVGLMTPATDMTRISDTFETNAGIDTVLRPGGSAVALYAEGHDLADPYLSPLYGDFTKGFPPTFLQSGTRDLLLSDTVRMHRALLKAGIPAELHVWEAMPHGGFGGIFGTEAPEDAEMVEALVGFVERQLG